jgi:hypothetical protein
MRDKIVSLQAVLYLLNKTGPIFESEFEALLYLANKRCFFKYSQCVTRHRFSLTTFSPCQEKLYISTFRHPDFRESILVDGYHLIALTEPDMDELSKASVECMDYALEQRRVRGDEWLRWESWKPTEWEQVALDVYHSPETQEIRKEFDRLCKEICELMPGKDDHRLGGLHYHICDHVCPDNTDSDDDWFWAFADLDNKETLQKMALEYRKEIDLFRDQLELEEKFEQSFENRKILGQTLNADAWVIERHFPEEPSDGES